MKWYWSITLEEALIVFYCYFDCMDNPRQLSISRTRSCIALQIVKEVVNLL